MKLEPGTPAVLLEERAAASGRILALATLNSPKTLNGLSLEMAAALDRQLAAWARDERVAAVVLQGAGDKAFCAGGDLHALYRSMKSHGAPAPRDILVYEYAREFFATEYRLDYRIHNYPKPILCWGHGVVMGGGIGLMAGASHRVVTETSRLAMPEITVGLYPDVGGSWLLGRVPMRGGRFLALTGAPLNAPDAIFCGLADYFSEEAQRAAVVDDLTALAWTRDRAENDRLIDRALRARASRAPVAAPFRTNLDRIADACSHPTLEDVVAAIGRLRDVAATVPWLSKAIETLTAGSPGSARIAWEIQERARHLSLAGVFRLEYLVSLHSVAHGDFAEGIRALLIDKDRTPAWNPRTAMETSRDWAAAFFVAPWAADEHPLAGLEASVARDGADAAMREASTGSVSSASGAGREVGS